MNNRRQARARAALQGCRLILIEDDLINGERGRPPTNRATQDQPHLTNLSDPQSVCVCLFVCWGGTCPNASDSSELEQEQVLSNVLDFFFHFTYIVLVSWHQ